MWMRNTVFLVAIAASAGAAQAQEFEVVKVPSVVNAPVDQLKPQTIIFNDHREDPLFESGSGFIRFEEWGKSLPVQKQFLSLFPNFTEGMTTKTVEGMSTTYKD